MTVLVLPDAVDLSMAARRALFAEVQGCHVVRVIDGDTVQLWCPSIGSERGRLNGIDTPEVFSPDCQSEWLRGQSATWALRWRLWVARDVRVVKSGVDFYDRALVSIFVDGRSVARDLIASGHGRPYQGERRAGWCA